MELFVALENSRVLVVSGRGESEAGVGLEDGLVVM
jgi:hypothetical protein